MDKLVIVLFVFMFVLLFIIPAIGAAGLLAMLFVGTRQLQKRRIESQRRV